MSRSGPGNIEQGIMNVEVRYSIIFNNIKKTERSDSTLRNSIFLVRSGFANATPRHIFDIEIPISSFGGIEIY